MWSQNAPALEAEARLVFMGGGVTVMCRARSSGTTRSGLSHLVYLCCDVALGHIQHVGVSQILCEPLPVPSSLVAGK